MRSTSSSISFLANSSGLAMVAEERMKMGLVPYQLQIRLSLRMTLAQVTPEDPPVLMDFIYHHIFQILEELHPLCVVREDSGVQHVWIGDDDMSCGTDSFSGIDRGIAIIGVRLDINIQSSDQSVEFVQLILGEGLGGEEVDGTRVWILKEGIGDRYVVA